MKKKIGSKKAEIAKTRNYKTPTTNKLNKDEERMIEKHKAFEEALIEECEREKAKSNRRPHTAILYKDLPGDKVIITGFYGFLTITELAEKYGRNIGRAYGAGIYRTYREYAFNGDEKLVVLGGELGEFFINIGSVYSKKEFLKIKKTIKQCGSYLHDLIVAMKGEDKVAGI